MRVFLKRPALRVASLLAALAAAGCGNELGICYFVEQEESEELTQEECAERGGSWEPMAQSITGI